MTNPWQPRAEGTTPFEKIAIVFCVLVVFLAFLIAARFALLETRVHQIEIELNDRGLP